MPMISLKVDDTLAEEFDKIQTKMGFSSRSEALRASILLFIKNHQDYLDKSGHRIATITVFHDAKRQDIILEFAETIQKYAHIVKSEMQYNLKHHTIHIILCAGEGEEIEDLYTLLVRSKNFSCIMQYITLPDISDNEQENNQ